MLIGSYRGPHAPSARWEHSQLLSLTLPKPKIHPRFVVAVVLSVRSNIKYQKEKKKKHFPTGRMVSVTNIASEMKQGFYKPTSLCSTRPALLPLLSVLLCVGSAPLHSGEGSKRSLSCRQAAGFPACLITETAWSAQVLSYQIHLRLSVRVSQSWNLCPFKSYHLFHLRLCSPNLILTINQK